MEPKPIYLNGKLFSSTGRNLDSQPRAIRETPPPVYTEWVDEANQVDPEAYAKVIERRRIREKVREWWPIPTDR